MGASEAARVAICDPNSPVPNRLVRFMDSANTPDWQDNPNALINPDMTDICQGGVSSCNRRQFRVAMRYIKCVSGVPGALVRMNAGERGIMDTPPARVRPDCDANVRNRDDLLVWRVPGRPGEADVIQICIKDALDNFRWVNIVASPG